MAKIIKKYYTLYKTATDTNDYFWIKNESSSSTGYLSVGKQGDWDEPLECSFDKINWWSYKDTYSHQWAAGEKIYLRNSSGVFSSSSSKFAKLSQSEGKNISIGGDMTTLLNYTLSNTGDIKTLPDYCFYYLFNNISLLSVDCNIGGVETIGSSSFYYSFMGSTPTSVVFDMSNVKTIKGSGVRQMFQNCSNATSIDIDLSSLVTVGNYGMYNMFQNCSNATSIDIDLSSLETVGTNGMYGMFNGCYYITEGVDLKSVTTVGFNGMYQLYNSCYALSEATAPNVETWNLNNFSSWLSGAGINVSGTKTVNCPTGVTIPTNDVSGIPTDWTRTDY